MTMRLAPEFDMFCLALRVLQQPEEAAALRNAIAARPDWNAIVKGARRHRLAARALAGLQACGAAGVPDKVINALRRQSATAVQHDLAQTAEIARLMRRFADAGVRALVLKGAVLSAQLHDGAYPRGARDIDLLVDPAQTAQAHALLDAAGYRSLHPARSPAQGEAYRRAIKDVEYVRIAGGVRLELHDRLTDNPNLLRCDFEVLWREREAVELGGYQVPPSPASACRFILPRTAPAMPGERLRWLVDLAAALRAPGGVEADLTAADANGLGAAMRHALLLAHDWLGLSVAAGVRRKRARSPVCSGSTAFSRIFMPTPPGSRRRDAQPGGALCAIRSGSGSIACRSRRTAATGCGRYGANGFRRTTGTWCGCPTLSIFLYPVIRPIGWLLRRRRR